MQNTDYGLTEQYYCDIESAGAEKFCVRQGTNCWNFLVNHSCNRALMVCEVIYNKRKTSYTAIDGDYMNRYLTVQSAHRGIQQFFQANPNYHLVVPIANTKHEMCLFVKRSPSGSPHTYDCIYYNPNASETINTIVDSLMTKLGRLVVRQSRSYASECGNVDGICLRLTFDEIMQFMIGQRGNMPPEHELLCFNPKTRKYTQPTCKRHH